jgi:hypothetical protein
MEKAVSFAQNFSYVRLGEFHRSGDTDAQTAAQVSATRKGFREILEVCGYAVVGKDQDPAHAVHSGVFSH